MKLLISIGVKAWFFCFPIGKFGQNGKKSGKSGNFTYFYVLKKSFKGLSEFLSKKCTFFQNLMLKHWYLRKLERFQCVCFFYKNLIKTLFSTRVVPLRKKARDWSKSVRGPKFSQNVSNILNLKVKFIY